MIILFIYGLFLSFMANNYKSYYSIYMCVPILNFILLFYKDKLEALILNLVNIYVPK